MILSPETPIEALVRGGKSKTTEALNSARIFTLADLLGVFPLRIQKAPHSLPFSMAQNDKLFMGRGKVAKILKRPAFSRGKKKIRLMNVNVIVMDMHPEGRQIDTIVLSWFNCYPSMVKKLDELNEIDFMGQIKEFQGKKQIANPNLEPGETQQGGLIVQYPTINAISGTHIKKLIDKIPTSFFEIYPDPIPEQIIKLRKLYPLAQCYMHIHGRTSLKFPWHEEDFEQVRERLVYGDFFEEQIKIHLRKNKTREIKSPVFHIKAPDLNLFLNSLPYKLTQDQLKVLDDVRKDFTSGHPMMRLLQGDVGCGKTTVAALAAFIAAKNKFQVALMCPTEALATQHANGLFEICQKLNFNLALILGNHKASAKKVIYQKLNDGEIDIVIGTHALIQEDVSFKKLGLVIIDEQHKFGVEQRIKLTSKGEGVHCLIMTATPIPRSLGLTQYGDLDISTIRQMPAGRRPIKTRIVPPNLFATFLKFLKTRMEMGEQGYIVVPAIEESESADFLHLEKVLTRFQQIFPDYKIKGLHGQLKADEKQSIFDEFVNKKINLLIATSVVEVGINNTNATIMAIMNPERFGLSSLHQLRGRVGRGSLPGFCFLIVDKAPSLESQLRLKVIESTLDGFKIAEEDLKIRGEGELFGTRQSGVTGSKKFANLVRDFEKLELAKKDVDHLFDKIPQTIGHLVSKIQKDPLVFQTI